MGDHLVDGHLGALLAGHLDAAGGSVAGPRPRVAPGLRELVELGYDPLPPPLAEPLAVARRATVQGLLARGRREREGQAVEMVELVGDGVLRAGSGCVELVVARMAYEVGDGPGGWSEIERGCPFGGWSSTC